MDHTQVVVSYILNYGTLSDHPQTRSIGSRVRFRPDIDLQANLRTKIPPAIEDGPPRQRSAQNRRRCHPAATRGPKCRILLRDQKIHITIRGRMTTS